MQKKTILVVDDDIDILKLLSKILSAAGFHVLVASDPELGRSIIEKEPPHLIISDLHMEPENGFQFIQSLKSKKQYASIPIIVLSALNDFNSVKKAIGLGISDYAIKPLQSQMLGRKIRKALLNKDFIKWDAPDNIELKIELDVNVSALGETGYSLIGPLKLSENKEIKVSIPEFRELGLDQIPHRASSMPKTYQAGGHFQNDVTFVAINENASSKIRQFLTKRGAK